MHPPPLLPELRAATAAAHRALEAEVGIERRVADLPGYTDLLARFLGFYAPLEDRLGRLGWDPEIFAADERLTKTAWLEHDLGALGWTSAEISALPRCRRLPQLDNVSRGLGCAYVLEGATLGGRQISALLAAGAVVPGDAQRFFHSYGSPAAVGDRWREFTGALESFSRRPEARRAEVVAAANETFACLQDWLAGNGRQGVSA